VSYEITIDLLEFTRVEHEMAISRLRDVVGLLLRKIARASGDRVQHRFPDIRWLAVNQRHGDRDASGSPFEFARDRQPSDATAHDDNVMRTRHYAYLFMPRSVNNGVASRPSALRKPAAWLHHL
jgi:hypothetical protein